MTKEEISQMSEEERLYQLSWSDPFEFGTTYSYYLLEEYKYLNNLYNQSLKDYEKTLKIIEEVKKTIKSNLMGLGCVECANLLEIIERGTND